MHSIIIGVCNFINRSDVAPSFDLMSGLDFYALISASIEVVE